jgi:hypothetical protein
MEFENLTCVMVITIRLAVAEDEAGLSGGLVASSKSLQQLHHEEDVELPEDDEVQIPLSPPHTPHHRFNRNQTPRERPRPVGPDQACNTIARSTPHAPPMPPLLLATAT